MEEAKISFIKRLKIAIFKLEDYGLFLVEKLTKSFKYMILLILLSSVIMTAFLSFYRYKMISKAFSYVENELPDFTFKGGKLSFKDYVEGYDEKYSFRIIINTSDNPTTEELRSYKNKIYGDNYGIIFLNDKLIYYTGLTENEVSFKELSDLGIHNKQDLVNQMQDIGMFSIITAVIIGDFIVYFIYNFIFVMIAIFVVASVRIYGITCL